MNVFLHLCLGMPLWYPKQMSKSRISDNNTQFDFRRIYWLIYLLFRFCCWRSATLNILLLSTVDIKLHTYIHTYIHTYVHKNFIKMMSKHIYIGW